MQALEPQLQLNLEKAYTKLSKPCRCELGCNNLSIKNVKFSKINFSNKRRWHIFLNNKLHKIATHHLKRKFKKKKIEKCSICHNR
jgi:hypothetical protein